jgi:pantothenate kinase
VTRLIVGIAGAPGSGKSTLAAQIVAALDDAVLLPMDGFHLPQAELRRLGRRDRMGAPDTFDVDAFVATLTAVRFSADPVLAPAFDREIEDPVPSAIAISPEKRTVVVEGNYLLCESGGWERVAPLLDVSLFVELDAGIRTARLIERHVRFGKSPDAARSWALGPDETNARLIEATAHRADYRIRGW